MWSVATELHSSIVTPELPRPSSLCCDIPLKTSHYPGFKKVRDNFSQMGSPIKKHKYTSGLNVKCWTRLPWIWAQLDVMWRCDNDAASKVCNDDGIAWLRYVFKLNVIYLRNFKKSSTKTFSTSTDDTQKYIETNYVQGVYINCQQ